MESFRKIELGEYTITIEFVEATAKLSITVYDEIGNILEGISINNDEDQDSEIDPTLN